MSNNPKIVIIGAGPCGLGAAYRLAELGYKNFKIFEKNNYVGGIAASFKDKQGFTWDQGGHVIFSHYKYFDRLLIKLLKNKYCTHLRAAWIWIFNRFIPYPFQNNIRYLPHKLLWQCLSGLYAAQLKNKKIRNFKEWIINNFGQGIAKYFLLPYNFKVWATPLNKMSYSWIGERVSVVNFDNILKNILLKKDEVSWGPNNKFKFPVSGGTGGLFSAFMPYIKNHLYLNKEIKKINFDAKKIYFSDKTAENYDVLISTIPLDNLMRFSNCEKKYKKITHHLQHNSVYVIGIGLKKKNISQKCWAYFPEKNCPFYRVTYFSNYSPKITPSKNYSSLMCEVSTSANKKIDAKKIISNTIQGLINTKLIDIRDKKNIVSKFIYKIPYAYPVPTVKRDKILKEIQSYLEKHQIYSRGRFGAWKYEIGNMDHTTMQGVEIVNRLLKKEREKTWSL